MVYREGGSFAGCPRCATPITSEVGATKTFACTNCGGAFLPYATLSRHEEAVASVLMNRLCAVPLSPLECPICGAAMRRVVIETASVEVAIDYCGSHGAWFDRGELEQLRDLA